MIAFGAPPSKCDIWRSVDESLIDQLLHEPAIVGTGKGAAVGADVGAGVGAGSEIITKGNQVKAPSETLLDFML